jgi:acyl carrier protein
MQKLVSEDRVLDEVRKALSETLRIDAQAIRPESSVVRDLGAESLDFLDVNYRLEQTFGIKMARHFFLEHVEEMYGEGTAIDDEGRLTKAAMTLLAIRYRQARLPDPGAGLDMDEVPALITVQGLLDATMSILDSLPERCVCGASAWGAPDGTHIVCGACHEGARFTNGDELIRQWLAGVQAEAGLVSA